MGVFTTVSAKGQVVIPKEVRDRLRLAPGDRLEVVERADGVLLRRRPAPESVSFDAVTARIRGRVAYAGPPVSVEEMDEGVRAMWRAGGPDWGR